MKPWHHNVVRILKDPDVKSALTACLCELEGQKEHSIVLSMLSNYFNLRNKDFGSNWIYLPNSKVVLHLGKKGIYFAPGVAFNDSRIQTLVDLNDRIHESVGHKNWVLTFSKTSPPKIKDLLCQKKKSIYESPGQTP
jgi:hypothetical protein